MWRDSANKINKSRAATLLNFYISENLWQAPASKHKQTFFTTFNANPPGT